MGCPRQNVLLITFNKQRIRVVHRPTFIQRLPKVNEQNNGMSNGMRDVHKKLSNLME